MVPSQAATTATFAVRPLVGGGPSGSVTVTTGSAVARYHVVITGLMPGSSHAVHDHLGSCRAAAVSEHLAVLAVGVADASGVMTVDAALPAADAGAGRIVIVYASPSPALLTGCADL